MKLIIEYTPKSYYNDCWNDFENALAGGILGPDNVKVIKKLD